MEPTNSCSARGPSAAQDRRGDHFLNDDQAQIEAMAGVMRRAEDLADRITGAVPTSAGAADAKPPQGAGFIGALLDLQHHRNEIGARIGEALSRIEKVL